MKKAVLFSLASSLLISHTPSARSFVSKSAGLKMLGVSALVVGGYHFWHHRQEAEKLKHLKRLLHVKLKCERNPKLRGPLEGQIAQHGSDALANSLMKLSTITFCAAGAGILLASESQSDSSFDSDSESGAASPTDNLMLTAYQGLRTEYSLFYKQVREEDIKNYMKEQLTQTVGESCAVRIMSEQAEFLQGLVEQYGAQRDTFRQHYKHFKMVLSAAKRCIAKGEDLKLFEGAQEQKQESDKVIKTDTGEEKIVDALAFIQSKTTYHMYLLQCIKEAVGNLCSKLGNVLRTTPVNGAADSTGLDKDKLFAALSALVDAEKETTPKA